MPDVAHSMVISCETFWSTRAGADRDITSAFMDLKTITLAVYSGISLHSMVVWCFSAAQQGFIKVMRCTKTTGLMTRTACSNKYKDWPIARHSRNHVMLSGTESG